MDSNIIIVPDTQQLSPVIENSVVPSQNSSFIMSVSNALEHNTIELSSQIEEYSVGCGSNSILNNNFIEVNDTTLKPVQFSIKRGIIILNSVNNSQYIFDKSESGNGVFVLIENNIRLFDNSIIGTHDIFIKVNFITLSTHSGKYYKQKIKITILDNHNSILSTK